MTGVILLFLIGIIIGFAGGVFKKVPYQKKTWGIIEGKEQRQKEPYYRPTYTAVVVFNVDGEEFTTYTSYQANTFQIGKKVAVYYEDGNPTNNFVRASFILYAITYLCFIAGAAQLISLGSTGFN